MSENDEKRESNHQKLIGICKIQIELAQALVMVYSFGDKRKNRKERSEDWTQEKDRRL